MRPLKRNIGKTDRIIRFVAGLVIIGAGIYFKWWWGAVGIAPILTAAVGWTPAYVPFGISTCSSKSEDGQNTLSG
jgi:hypothetical protein